MNDVLFLKSYSDFKIAIPENFSLTNIRLKSAPSRIAELAVIAFNSPTFWIGSESIALLSFAAVVFTGSISMLPLTFGLAASVGLAAIGVQTYQYFPIMMYEISLPYILADVNNSSTKKWWNEIDEYLIVGGVPLKNEGHAEKLLTDVSVTAVLSVLEDFELTRKGVFTEPVSSKEWIERQVNHKVLNVVDCRPVPVQKLGEGVEFIRLNIANKKHVYVHCKAGHGRSVAIVVCYLLKYKPELKSVDEAYQFVKKCRPQVNLNKLQMKTVREYARIYCGK